jgi:hypothetical protein
MRIMKYTIRIATAIAMILGVGLVHGAWTSRWRLPPALKEVAGRIEALPTELGAWTMKADQELSPRELAMTGAVGHISRVYSRQKDGHTDAVSVLLLTGLAGNISTHTPDACYPGSGYTLGNPEKFSRRYGEYDRTAEFQTALAERGGTDPSSLRIFWSWRSSKGWSSPEVARWAFASEPMLTKLYVVREVGNSKVDPKDDPCNAFLAELLPVLDQAVAPSPQPTQDSAK